MIDCLVRSEDFERVLRTRSRAQSTHFALHHVLDRPSRPLSAGQKRKLSTDGFALQSSPVDDISAQLASSGLEARWLGTVVPKRYARRSVTRELLKRQIRTVVAAHAESIAAGLWVVRLRAPFDRGQFISASSASLKIAAREELEHLMRKASTSAPPLTPATGP